MRITVTIPQDAPTARSAVAFYLDKFWFASPGGSELRTSVNADTDSYVYELVFDQEYLDPDDLIALDAFFQQSCVPRGAAHKIEPDEYHLSG